MLNVLILTNL